MNIIFQVDGALDKNIAATAVCKAIKRQYPSGRLIVTTNFPDVFFCNPNVDKVLAGTDLLYFYSNNIEGQKVKMLLHDPFLATDFVSGNKHLIQVWCEMFGIKYNGEMPELFITKREHDFYSHQFGSDKPLMVLQTNKGIDQNIKYSWINDLPLHVAQKAVYSFANDYNIVHICKQDQFQLEGVTPLFPDFRTLMVLLSISEKRLLINSFLQHAAAALMKPSVVCWIGNDPKLLGYETHTNIVANSPTIKPDLSKSVFNKYSATGLPVEFPYNSETDIFDTGSIIEALRKDVEHIENESSIKANAKIAEKIYRDKNRRSMVAGRLSYLAGKVDISNVHQILDIGSWHLEQSIEFSNIFSNAKIDAFEPVPDSYQLCLSNYDKLDEQKKNRIHVHNIALSNEAGSVPFYSVDPSVPQKIDMGFSSMLRFNDGLKNSYYGDSLVQKEITVQADTLDNWCKSNNVSKVDILWIDVQGAELMVFKGAEDILRNTHIIMTEVGLKPYYEGHTLKADIDDFLSELGFKELEGAFELNGFDYEANTIYIRE